MVKWPEADEKTVEALRAAVFNDRWAIAQEGAGRDFVAEAEAALAARVGTKYAVTTCNGSAAIVIALRALGIGRGARVAVPAFTWVACATAVERAGAVPVFVDSLLNSPVMNPAAIPKDVSAVLAVHLYASYADIGDIKQRLPGIPIIEDFSHCFGAPGIGAAGDISICSFQASKVLTCGEGGAAFCNDYQNALRMEALRSDSRIRIDEGMVAGPVYGENYAISSISAALLVDQMSRFDNQCRRRAANLSQYLVITNIFARYDTRAVDGGSFYGIIVAGGEDSLSTYPLVPLSPFYQHTGYFRFSSFPNALQWSSKRYIPHERFL